MGEGRSSPLLRLDPSFPSQSATYLWIQGEPFFEGFSVSSEGIKPSFPIDDLPSCWRHIVHAGSAW